MENKIEILKDALNLYKQEEETFKKEEISLRELMNLIFDNYEDNYQENQENYEDGE